MSKKSNYKWIVLLLVSAAYFFAQGTRQIYACILPQLKIDFASLGITDTQFGLVGSTFTLVFGLFMPISGLIADMFSRKKVLLIGSVIFAIGIFVSGFANGLGMLFISYGIFNAVGQSLMPPCNTSYISQYHVETRGTAFSIYQTAIYLGIIICSVTSGYLSGMGEGGWRKAFWIFGAIAMLWTIIMAIFLKDTPKASNTEEEQPSIKEAVKAFFKKPSAILLMIALGALFFITYAFKLWAPTFVLQRFPDMTPAEAAFNATFWFFIGSLIGVMFGGRLSDKLKAIRPTIRLDIEIIGMVLFIPFILLMVYAENMTTILGAIFFFGLASGIYDSNLYAALFEVVNPHYRAVATGIFGGGGCIFGAVGPVVTGWLSDNYTINLSMASLSIIAVFGLFVLLYVKVFTFKKDMI